MIEFWIGYGCGAITFSFWAWRIHCHLTKRISENLDQEVEARYLEMRRETHDYGTTDEIPEGVGPAADVGSLFEIHPGAMTLGHLSERNEAERLARERKRDYSDLGTGRTDQNNS